MNSIQIKSLTLQLNITIGLILFPFLSTLADDQIAFQKVVEQHFIAGQTVAMEHLPHIE